jgi:hypothetical protein
MPERVVQEDPHGLRENAGKGRRGQEVRLRPAGYGGTAFACHWLAQPKLTGGEWQADGERRDAGGPPSPACHERRDSGGVRLRPAGYGGTAFACHWLAQPKLTGGEWQADGERRLVRKRGFEPLRPCGRQPLEPGRTRAGYSRPCIYGVGCAPQMPTTADCGPLSGNGARKLLQAIRSSVGPHAMILFDNLRAR